jgi:adenylosuccinate synthase
MFSPDRRCLVVVGAQWGDEGKGKIVDVIAERADLVIRYQGGANAGHTVVRGAERFVLHQIPAGILHPTTTCVIGNGVVLDPEVLCHEIAELTGRGVAVHGRLFVSDRAHLLLPYHKLIERATEPRQRIGTTGRGIGPAYEDKFGRRGHRAGELTNVAVLTAAVRERVREVNALLAAWGSDLRADPAEHAAFVEAVAPTITAMLTDGGRMAHRALQAGRTVLLEGAQGALLDVDHGTYPFVTSSNTTAGGAAVGSGIGPTAIDAVLGVTKAYTTRVGNGPFPTEAEAEPGETLRRIGREFGATTGRPRRCGWFDAVIGRYAVRVNGITAMAVTKLDVLDEFDEIPVCVRYRLDGEETDDVPADGSCLAQARPVFQRLRGWRRPIGEARRLADLPHEARAYLERLGEEAGTPIAYVSVGDRRDQIIEVAP